MRSISLLFNKVILDKRIFIALMRAVFSSFATGKTVYVYLDTKPSRHIKTANNLAGRIYNGLPNEIKKRFKYATAISEHPNAKGMNLVIADRFSKRQDNNSDCPIFDFINNRVWGVKRNSPRSPFMDFLWRNRKKPGAVNEFFELINSKSQTFDENRLLNIKTFDELYLIYQLYKGNAKRYEKQRTEIFNIVLAYSSKPPGVMEYWLRDALYMILEKEKSDTLKKIMYLSPPIIAHFFIDRYALFKNEQKQSIIILVVKLIQKGFERWHRQYSLDFIKRIVNNEAMLEDFLAVSYEDKRIFKSAVAFHLKERVINIHNLYQVFDELSFWSRNEGWAKYIFSYEPFIDGIKNKTLEIMSDSTNIIEDTNRVFRYLNGLQRVFASSIRNNLYNTFINELRYPVNEKLYLLLDIDKITWEQLNSIDFSVSSTNKKYAILLKLKMVLIGPQAHLLSEMRAAVNTFDHNSFKMLSGLIEKFMVNSIRESSFLRITCAFVTPGGYDYDGMFNYILYNGGRNKVYDFIKWSFNTKVFFDKANMSIRDRFVSSIVKYFKSMDKYAFIKNKSRQYLFTECSNELSNFFIGIEESVNNNFEDFGKIIREKLKHGESKAYPIVCPYCFKRFLHEEVVFRISDVTVDNLDNISAHRDTVLNDYRRKLGLNELGEIGDVIDPDSLGEKFRKNIDGILAEIIDRHGNATHTRLCPYCHNELFPAAGKMSACIISTVGMKDSGKTTYISVLLNTLMTRTAKGFAASCMPADNNTNEVIKELYLEPLFKKGSLPEVTSMETPLYPLILQFKFKGEKRMPFLLYIYDFAGEGIIDQRYLDVYAANIRNSDALMIFVAPWQLRGLENRITIKDNKADIRTFYDMGEPRDIIINLYENFINMCNNQRTDIPTAIVLTGGDRLHAVKDELGCEGKVFMDYAHTGYFNIDEYEIVSRNVTNLFKGCDSIFTDYVDVYFSNASYFAVSALRDLPNSPLLKNSVDPVRVDEPLLWLLYQLKYIEGRHSR